MASRVVYSPLNPPTPRFRISKIKYGGKYFWKTALVVLIVLILAGGLIYMSRLPYFKIKRTEFSGLVALDRQELEQKTLSLLEGKYLKLLPKDFYFLVSTDKLARELKKEYPRIENIEISRHLPDSLSFKIKERELFGILCGLPDSSDTERQKCFFLDKTGFAYEESPSSKGSLLLTINTDALLQDIGVQIIDRGLVEKFESVSRESLSLVGSAVIGYEIFSKLPEEFRAVSAGGYKLYLNKNDDFSKVFKVLKVVLDKEIGDKQPQLEYIDLRFGNKVFYKFKKTAAVSTPAASDPVSATAASSTPSEF